eukprot:354056-Chlamydomonas_euryale.AAC.2
MLEVLVRVRIVEVLHQLRKPLVPGGGAARNVHGWGGQPREMCAAEDAVKAMRPQVEAARKVRNCLTGGFQVGRFARQKPRAHTS